MYESLAIATAYADAKGLPYETKTKQQILELGGVGEHILEPSVYSPDFPDFQGKPAGTWSDDTQHTLAMMESLSTVRGFNLQNLAYRLRQEMDRSSAGWGGATKRSIEKVDETMTPTKLRRLGEKDSNGCGPLMRLTPLVLFSYFNPSMNDSRNLSERALIDSTVLTHNSSSSIVSAQTHSDVLKELIRTGGDTQVSKDAWYAAQRREKWFDEDPILSKKIVRIFRSQDLAGDVYEDSEEAFSVWSVQSVAYGVYDRMSRAPFKDLIDAVIAEGGDTDSTAALAAGMWICAHPDGDIQVEVSSLDQSVRLIDTGQTFAELLANQSF